MCGKWIAKGSAPTAGYQTLVHMFHLDSNTAEDNVVCGNL